MQRLKSLIGLAGSATKQTRKAAKSGTLINENNLFQILSRSPLKQLRDRAEFIKRHGTSPTGKSIAFDCPESGWPTHHDAQEWEADVEKAKTIPILRQANEDEHDLRSGRELTEFNFPGSQDIEEAINMLSWDGFLYVLMLIQNPLLIGKDEAIQRSQLREID